MDEIQRSSPEGHRRFQDRRRIVVECHRHVPAPQVPLAAVSPSDAVPQSAVEEATAWSFGAADWCEPGWLGVSVRPAVRRLLSLPPGPELLAGLQEAAADPLAAAGGCGWLHPPIDHPVRLDVAVPVGVSGAPCACQVIVSAAWQAFASWSTERADASLVAAAGPVPRVFAGTDPRAGIVDPCVEELAPAWRSSPRGLRTRLDKSRRRVRYPDLSAAIRSGALVGWHADLVLADLDDLPAEVRDQVIADLLARIEHRRSRRLRSWTLTELRQFAKRRAASLDPRSLRARRRRAHQGRGVRLQHHRDGSASLIADLPDDVATRIQQRLTALAHGLGGDDGRSVEQRRADLLTDLLLDSRAHGVPAPAAAGGRQEVAVVVSLPALLGLTDSFAEIPGCSGPVPADLARELAADRRWRLWLTNAAGAVVATSAQTYRPTAAVARLVRAREPVCRMPGCRDRAHHDDLDHVVNHPDGPTDPRNLAVLCRRHHRMKTHLPWRLANRFGDDGDLAGWTWTGPSGLSATDAPEPPLDPEPPPEPWS